jgi:hypothetical protein
MLGDVWTEAAGKNTGISAGLIGRPWAMVASAPVIR